MEFWLLLDYDPRLSYNSESFSLRAGNGPDSRGSVLGAINKTLCYNMFITSIYLFTGRNRF